MKPSFFRLFFAGLLLSLLASCATQRGSLIVGNAVERPRVNTLTRHGVPVLTVGSSEFGLEDRTLLLGRDVLAQPMQRHLTRVLRECYSIQDTVLAASHDFIVLKSRTPSPRPDANVLYFYDTEYSRWTRSYIDAYDVNVSIAGNPPSFFRKLYIVKRRNRVIVKDYFGDMAVVYVIQGRDIKTPFFTTTIWSPAHFPTLITTADYIRGHIDPKSCDIAAYRAKH